MNGITTQQHEPERRQHPRVPLRRMIAVFSPKWSSFWTLGHDLSRGGIRLSLPYDTRGGDCVSVALDQAAEHPVTLTAQVHHVRPGRTAMERVAGLRWVAKTAEADQKLSSLIDELREAPIEQLIPRRDN